LNENGAVFLVLAIECRYSINAYIMMIVVEIELHNLINIYMSSVSK